MYGQRIVLGTFFHANASAFVRYIMLLLGRSDIEVVSSRKSYDYDAALRYGLLAIVMIYPQNTRLIIESLNCVTISDGTSYLAADFSIECSSSSYSSMDTACTFQKISPVSLTHHNRKNITRKISKLKIMTKTQTLTGTSLHSST